MAFEDLAFQSDNLGKKLECGFWNCFILINFIINLK